MPTFAEGWTIGKPDAVFAMNEAYQIPATGVIEYQYIRIPTNITEDKWLRRSRSSRSARAHVHHVHRLHAARPARRCNEGGALGPGNIGGVTPNKPGVVFDPGVGRMLTANSDIILQMHYTTNGEAAIDRTQVGVASSPRSRRSRQQRGGSVIQPRFVIPAGAPSARSPGLARAAGRHHHDVADAAHARARQGHDLHRELS